MSPSLLHNRGYVGNFDKENMGYELRTNAGGCNRLLCWKKTKHNNKGKVKPGTPVRLHKKRHFSYVWTVWEAKKDG
ncbi:hypothetical protein IFM89_019183 [Coptis chinensis]|uniref:Uncharacterized protein n=1 Tax=Coptis chinensis TaxID=261450 RepID=A0A835LBC5_9MAGN|nr:hypothetical protein IFM89_019183 [Coptis chinensis]